MSGERIIGSSRPAGGNTLLTAIDDHPWAPMDGSDRSKQTS